MGRSVGRKQGQGYVGCVYGVRVRVCVRVCMWGEWCTRGASSSRREQPHQRGRVGGVTPRGTFFLRDPNPARDAAIPGDAVPGGLRSGPGHVSMCARVPQQV